VHTVGLWLHATRT